MPSALLDLGWIAYYPMLDATDAFGNMAVKHGK